MTNRIDTAKERVAAILDDWEYQARERDIRDPMRGQILEEAALIRHALNCRDAEIERLRAENERLRAVLVRIVEEEDCGGPECDICAPARAALNPKGET